MKNKENIKEKKVKRKKGKREIMLFGLITYQPLII